jgi:hypothetical protein
MQIMQMLLWKTIEWAVDNIKRRSAQVICKQARIAGMKVYRACENVMYA